MKCIHAVALLWSPPLPPAPPPSTHSPPSATKQHRPLFWSDSAFNRARDFIHAAAAPARWRRLLLPLNFSSSNSNNSCPLWMDLREFCESQRRFVIHQRMCDSSLCSFSSAESFAQQQILSVCLQTFWSRLWDQETRPSRWPKEEKTRSTRSSILTCTMCAQAMMLKVPLRDNQHRRRRQKPTVDGHCCWYSWNETHHFRYNNPNDHVGF